MRVTMTFALISGLMLSAAGYFMRPFDAGLEYRSVSKYLAAHTRPQDRVLVWGSVPEIYWASGTRPATRFVTTAGFLGGAQPGRPAADAAPEESSPIAWDWFFEDLAAHPLPRFIVDTAPAQIRGAQYAPIERFPKLEAMVQSRYRFVSTIDGIDLYERIPA